MRSCRCSTRKRSPGVSVPPLLLRMRATERLSAASRPSRRAVSRAVSWPLATPCAMRCCWLFFRSPIRPASAGEAEARTIPAAPATARTNFVFRVMYLASETLTSRMEPGLQKASRGSLFVAVAALALLWRAIPLQRAYAAKLSLLHGRGFIAAAAGAAAVLFALLWLGLRRNPRPTLVAAAALALAMTALSRNLAAALAAGLLCAAMFLLGDRLFRLLCGADASEGDLSAVFAAGLAGAGLLVLILSEVGRLSISSLALVAL